MMEIIDWVEHEEKGRWNNPNLVAYALIEVMSAKVGESYNIEEVFSPFNSKELNVEFKVNGVEVSFVGVMDKIQKAVESIEEDCRKTLIKDAAQDIIDKIHNEYKLWERE